MQKAFTVASREFHGFLRMPLGYALLAVYALVSGMVLITLLYLFRDQVLWVAQQAHIARPSQLVVDVQTSVITPYLLNVATLLLVIVPFLTMRSFAEEKRSRSLEVLFSYPLSAWEIVFGKFLGTTGFLLLLLAISALHLLILSLVSNPDPLPMLGGLLGLVLMGMALVAMGLFVSSLTAGQVEAAVLTLGLFLILAMASEVGKPGGSGLRPFLVHLSPLYRYQDFARGVLAPAGVLSYPAATLLFVALTLRGLDLLKWRG